MESSAPRLGYQVTPDFTSRWKGLDKKLKEVIRKDDFCSFLIVASEAFASAKTDDDLDLALTIVGSAIGGSSLQSRSEVEIALRALQVGIFRNAQAWNGLVELLLAGDRRDLLEAALPPALAQASGEKRYLRDVLTAKATLAKKKCDFAGMGQVLLALADCVDDHLQKGSLLRLDLVEGVEHAIDSSIISRYKVACNLDRERAGLS
jgi:hypothetical protein